MYYFIAIILSSYYLENDAALFNLDINVTDSPEIRYPLPDLSTMPDTYLNPSELFTKYGYYNERHRLKTMDGYELCVYRAYHPNLTMPIEQRHPILLLHGIQASATDYIMLGPNDALSFLLADQGYDVWLISGRGTIDCSNNGVLNNVLQGSSYWDFSFHETGIYDLPAAIDHILMMTGQPSLTQVGHSQGSASLFVLLSERPEYNDKIRSHIGYAPSVMMSNMGQILLRIFAMPEYFRLYSIFISTFGAFDMTPYMPSVQRMMVNACTPRKWTFPFCKWFLGWLFSLREPIDELIPVFFGHNPAQSSFKQYIHLSQSINSGQFARFQSWPWSPRVNYNLNNVKVPIYIFSGNNDVLVSPIDTKILERRLQRNVIAHHIIPNFGHYDFVIGKRAKDSVFLPTIEYLRAIYYTPPLYNNETSK